MAVQGTVMRQATTRCIQVSLPPIQFRPVTSPLSRPSLSPRPPSSRHQLTPSCARESHAENRLYSPVSSFRAKVLPHRAEARAVPALRDMSESSVGRAQGTTTNAPRIATVHVRPRACKSGQHSVRDHLPPARTPRPVSSPPPRDDLVCAAFPTAQCALRPLRLAAGRLGPRAPVVHAMPHSSSSPPPPTPHTRTPRLVSSPPRAVPVRRSCGTCARVRTGYRSSVGRAILCSSPPPPDINTTTKA